MGYYANIRTIIKLQPQSIFQGLARMGVNVHVASSQFPSLRLGIVKYAVRGIEVNELAEGYEVVVREMASSDDFQLFSKTVQVIKELTEGDVYAKGDDKPIKDPKKSFGLKWRREQEAISWGATCDLIKKNRQPVRYEGLNAPFVLDYEILKSYNVDFDNPTASEYYKFVGYQLFFTQWEREAADHGSHLTDNPVTAARTIPHGDLFVTDNPPQQNIPENHRQDSVEQQDDTQLQEQHNDFNHISQQMNDTFEPEHSNQGIKFLVDEVFPRPSEMLHCIYDSDRIERIINDDKQGADYHCINSSFRGSRLAYLGKDTLYQCIVKAYASHRPLILSPDMIWLVICQGLSKYVNDHPEECRNALVSHDGRMTLLVRTEQNLREPDVNWESLLGKMLSEVANNTKGDFVSSVDLQFTTTSANEHIALQTTVMDIVKPYFEFVFLQMICGIPYIRLLGTTEDWKKIKTNSAILNRFGLDWWYNDLAPILEQFVNASQGRIDTKFWRSMVQKKHDFLFDGGGGCDPFGNSKINGWCLKLFPFTEHGRTPVVVVAGHEMLPEYVKVPFKYVQHFPNGGEEVFNMELCSGFVGVEEDPVDHALCPKIGWMVSEKPSIEENSEWMNHNLDRCSEIRVKKVPEILREMKHIRTLTLTFIDDVVLPDWMDELEIDDFTIIGRANKETKAMIMKRFPNVNFYD